MTYRIWEISVDAGLVKPEVYGAIIVAQVIGLVLGGYLLLVPIGKTIGVWQNLRGVQKKTEAMCENLEERNRGLEELKREMLRAQKNLKELNGRLGPNESEGYLSRGEVVEGFIEELNGVPGIEATFHNGMVLIVDQERQEPLEIKTQVGLEQSMKCYVWGLLGGDGDVLA